jgi:tetratricopeptide (TPR) repeat protein
MAWLWFLLALMPVAGFVQTWEQARADRFTYLPHVGLAVAAAWGFAALARGLPRFRPVLLLIAVAALAALLATAHRQAAYWRDASTLFEHALAVTDQNWLAHASLGSERFAAGDYKGAELEMRRALAIRPVYAMTHYNFGLLLQKTARPREAAEHYVLSIEQDPTYSPAYTNLGVLFEDAGRIDDAEAHYRKAIAINPWDGYARTNLARVLARRGLKEEAAGRESPQGLGNGRNTSRKP